MAYLFISHDLSVVRYLCNRVMVMYLGKIVESGTRDEIFAAPAHPYTKALLSAIPIPDTEVRMNRIILKGDIPSPVDIPPGCRFAPRCPKAGKECTWEEPPFVLAGSETHRAACIKLEVEQGGSGI
jgi:oligopeptide/dipeptide ABC transporter ATP-binding protein